jgi:ribosome-associated protein YbcJ (S4-like RNA binding protein)
LEICGDCTHHGTSAKAVLWENTVEYDGFTD